MANLNLYGCSTSSARSISMSFDDRPKYSPTISNFNSALSLTIFGFTFGLQWSGCLAKAIKGTS